jgi:S-DNA-T family DNA segregation ATPase FtsK/SpoIIIE
MRRPEYLLFTVLSPVMMAGQWLSDRTGRRKSARAERANYQARRLEAQQELVAALASESVERHRRAPDPALLWKAACAPTSRLWERRRGDSDFLLVRLGCGILPAEVEVTGGPDMAPAQIVDVPITVALQNVGVLGVSAPAARAASLARAIVGQLAVLHSPRDLGVVLLTEPARVESWDWLRWLPHVRPASGLTCQALVGLDADSVAARVGELAALVEARRDAAKNGGDVGRRAIVVVVDGARTLRRTAALAQVLAQGRDVGVYAVCLDEDESRLPEECGAVAVVTGEVATRFSLRVSGLPATQEAIADGVSIMWADRIARALAPLRDDTPGRGSDVLPDTVRWLDIAGVADDVTSDLLTRWRRPGAGGARALIGVGPEGSFAVDIARDGPHALIAGTTGSGKSELLQTLVASLAVANRPDDLTFVLVDYKGGAAFGACAALPHTVGMVTDLDGGLVERALVSLSAELKRREALLARVAAPNIDTFRASGGVLPRLVIVVDEFASLAEELPEFVGGLVGIAQRGRSLGVHLVLATQRPEGVVSADIRANANLRICLAVMRDSESRDVIEAPDAARISRTTPGRGYARTGHGELHAFQSGRVGGAAQAMTDDSDVDVRLSPFRALCLPAPVRRVPVDEHRDVAKTDLDLIVAACREAAIRLDIDTPASPWLAPLPEVVVADSTSMTPLVAALGVHDVPARQARASYLIDLDRTGHLVIAGSARSGRTTALRTLAGGLATSTSVSDLHLYAFDCAGGSLGALSALPHCGAVVSAHEPERARRLVSMLIAHLTERQSLLAGQGLGSLTEQRARSADPLPHLLVLVDGWEALLATFEDIDAGAVVDALSRLLREGASVGIHVIVTADRAGLVGRLASSVENRIVLRLADRTDFSLIGLPVRATPPTMLAGRGFLVDGLVETQICLLSADPSGPAQLAAVAQIAATTHARDADVPRSQWPRRVDPLPTRITLRDIANGAQSAPAEHNPSLGSARVVLGVGGDELAPVSIDLLDSGPGFLVAGPPRSGRSTALATIGAGLRAAGWQVVALTPRPSAVRDHADQHFEPADLRFADALADVHGRLAVLVDDAELVTESPAAGVLDRLMRAARDAGHIVAIAGITEDLSVGFRGFIVEARRARTGLLMAPRGSLDGELLGVRLPRSTGGVAPAGRGLLVIRGSVSQVQVALPS